MLQLPTIVHDKTGYSPNFLLFWRELVSAVDIAFGCPRPPTCSVNHYAYHTSELMAEAYALVHEHTGRCAEVMKKNYDAGARPVESQVNDLVWYFCLRARVGTSSKWTHFYSGPYGVVRKINEINYVIQLTPKSRQIIVHVNKLKKYNEFQLV